MRDYTRPAMKRPAVTRLTRLVAALAAAVGIMALLLPATLAASKPSPLARALDFLSSQQLTQPLDVVVDGNRVLDFEGDWPQSFGLRGVDWFRVRDVSPFVVAFIHHALTQLVEANRRELGLSATQLWSARLMRQRAIAFMRRFESPAGQADAGTYGFWPYDVYPGVPNPLVAFFFTAWLGGPQLGGQRVPINLPVFPDALAIPSDADVTATTYASLFDDALFDGGPGTEVAFERFFVDWRDRGLVPRRENPPWLPSGSGAYLTWLTYRSDGQVFPNDVDLVVNGNVLYALGRTHRLGVAGTTEAAALINLTAALGLHLTDMRALSSYYPDNLAFQFIVSRAFHDGHVAALAPAVTIFATDLETSVRYRADGTAFWDHGDPQLNTAFAVLTLLNAGRESPIVDQAIDYLVAEQRASGGFDDAVFFVGRADNGQEFQFTSASFTTAMALEAFARHDLQHCGGPGSTLATRAPCPKPRVVE